MKNIFLILFLVLAVGCAHDPGRNVHLVAGPQRTVCIQLDPAQPEMALVVKPLKEKLQAKGYKIVDAPEKSEHTIRLQLDVFDAFPTLNDANRFVQSHKGYRYSPGSSSSHGNSLPGITAAGGTAIGGAVSGSALHAGLTTGGPVGGAVGLIFGTLLSQGSDCPVFLGSANVWITDPFKGEQHTGVGKIWRLLKDYNDPLVRKQCQQIAAEYMAGQVAALMP